MVMNLRFSRGFSNSSADLIRMELYSRRIAALKLEEE